MNRRRFLLSALAAPVIGAVAAPPLLAAERAARDARLLASAPYFLWVNLLDLEQPERVWAWVDRHVGLHPFITTSDAQAATARFCRSMYGEHSAIWCGGGIGPLKRSIAVTYVVAWLCRVDILDNAPTT